MGQLAEKFNVSLYALMAANPNVIELDVRRADTSGFSEYFAKLPGRIDADTGPFPGNKSRVIRPPIVACGVSC